jgi:hypothetical protein
MKDKDVFKDDFMGEINLCPQEWNLEEKKFIDRETWYDLYERQKKNGPAPKKAKGQLKLRYKL